MIQKGILRESTGDPGGPSVGGAGAFLDPGADGPDGLIRESGAIGRLLGNLAVRSQENPVEHAPGGVVGNDHGIEGNVALEGGEIGLQVEAGGAVDRIVASGAGAVAQKDRLDVVDVAQPAVGEDQVIALGGGRVAPACE